MAAFAKPGPVCSYRVEVYSNGSAHSFLSFFAVVRVRENLAHVNDFGVEVDGGAQPIVVAADIKDDFAFNPVR